MHSIFSSTLKQKVFYTDEDDNTPVFVHKGRSKDTLFWPKKNPEIFLKIRPDIKQGSDIKEYMKVVKVS